MEEKAAHNAKIKEDEAREVLRTGNFPTPPMLREYWKGTTAQTRGDEIEQAIRKKTEEQLSKIRKEENVYE